MIKKNALKMKTFVELFFCFSWIKASRKKKEKIRTINRALINETKPTAENKATAAGKKSIRYRDKYLKQWNPISLIKCLLWSGLLKKGRKLFCLGKSQLIMKTVVIFIWRENKFAIKNVSLLFSRDPSIQILKRLSSRVPKKAKTRINRAIASNL